MWIPIGLGCRALLSCQGEEWWSYYIRLHFLRARRHWSLRTRLVTASRIPTYLSAFVSMTVVSVPE